MDSNRSIEDRLRYWDNMLLDLVRTKPLVFHDAPEMRHTKVPVHVSHYGEYMEHTDQVDLEQIDPIIQMYAEEYTQSIMDSLKKLYKPKEPTRSLYETEAE